MTDVSAPVSPSDRQKMKTMLSEITHCMKRVDDEKEAIKEIVTEISNEFSVPKKLVNKIARTMHKCNYNDVQSENQHFAELYESLVEGKLDAKK